MAVAVAVEVVSLVVVNVVVVFVEVIVVIIVIVIVSIVVVRLVFRVLHSSLALGGCTLSRPASVDLSRVKRAEIMAKHTGIVKIVPPPSWLALRGVSFSVCCYAFVFVFVSV